ncbi:MAG: hypothetical protein M0Z66_10800 [Thermaerobacter sp.]|nr:hypothetical protein [Thermaerobacter sp.]
MRLRAGWLASVAAGVVGLGLVLGAGVASGASPTGQNLFNGYGMMTLFGASTAQGTTGSQGNPQLDRQNMLSVHNYMLRWAETGTNVPAQIREMMVRVHGTGSQAGTTYGSMMSGYLQQGSGTQGEAYGSMMGGY